MRINSIYIHHLLSFDTFVWKGLDPHFNAIVGPNGAGKTNLFHALRAVRDALSSRRSEVTARWVDAGHQGSNTDTATIMLDLQFTTEWEQRFLCTFLASVLCNQEEIYQVIRIPQRGLNPDGLRQFASWVQAQLRPEDLSWLFAGRLVVTYARRQGWQCRYEARLGNPVFRLDLTGGGTLVGHALHNAQAAALNWGSLFAAWHTSLTAQERTQLDDELTGTTSGVGFPTPDLSRLPSWVSSQQGISLRLEDSLQIVDPETLATRRAFASVTQVAMKPGEFFAIRSVFERLLDHALAFTDNVRFLPRRTFNAMDLLREQIDLSSGAQLALFLFRKKNGNHRDRTQYAAVLDLFFRVTGRKFDIVVSSVELPASFGNSLQGQQQPQSGISLELVISAPWGDIPLEFSGAGIAEALFLSAILAGSTGQVVFLDEPALNLHPTMQTTLLSEMLADVGQPESERSQFLVNTHAPNLVPPDAIERVSRLAFQDGHTIRRALRVRQSDEDDIVDAQQISPNDMVKLRKLLRGNLSARALLFSRAVLLVEGETELGALLVWCPDLVTQDIALYAVGGTGEFASPLKLIHHFAIPWAILGDGELLWDRHQRGHSHGPQDHINSILSVCNQTLPSIPGDPGSNVESFVAWRQALEASGIFTLAGSTDEGFEKAVRPEVPPELWAEAEKKFNKNKVALGRFIAENFPCPGNVAELMRKVLCHLQKQDASISVPTDRCS